MTTPAAGPRTFCSFAWEFVCVSLDAATTQVCCKTPIHEVTPHHLDKFGVDVIDNTQTYRARREELLAGIETEDCSACWDIEHAGGISFRQKTAITSLPAYLEAVPHSVPPQMPAVMQALPAQPQARFVQIKLGNPCDLKCVYCCAYYSSAWEIEDERAGLAVVRARSAPPDVKDRFADYFWQWFGRLEHSLCEVEFIGGEPTFNNALYDALEKIQAICAGWDESRMPLVVIVTNLNTPRPHWERLRRFVAASKLRFRFTISNESWGPRAEYIRFGMRWARFQDNFRDLVELAAGNDRVEMIIMPSMNALCVSSIGEYLDWVRGLSESLHDRGGRRIGAFLNEVQSPACLSTAVLPAHYADYLDRAIDCMGRWPAPDGGRGAAVHAGVRDALLDVQQRIRTQSVDPQLAKQFAEWIRGNDQRRQLDSRAIFPEYEAVLAAHL